MSANNAWGRRRLGRLVAAIVLCALVNFLIFGLAHRWSRQAGEAQESTPSEDSHQGELVAGEPETIQLTDAVVGRLGIKTVPVELSPQSDELKLDGYLSVDPARLARVHARFAGEIVELAKHPGRPYEPGRGEEKSATIRFGDEVKKDQLLAVIWSKDLGEKKSEFVDDYLQTALDRGTVDRLEALYETGATAERSLREAERRLETDVISQERAERTLRSWRLTDAEIESLRTEADTIRRTKQRDKGTEKNWPRVEVRSPLDGRIVEMNVAAGDIIDTSLDLFKICDLHQLRAMCNLYEEEMPRVRAIKPEQRYWKIWTAAGREGKPLRAARWRSHDVRSDRPDRRSEPAYGARDGLGGESEGSTDDRAVCHGDDRNSVSGRRSGDPGGRGDRRRHGCHAVCRIEIIDGRIAPIYAAARGRCPPGERYNSDQKESRQTRARRRLRAATGRRANRD